MLHPARHRLAAARIALACALALLAAQALASQHAHVAEQPGAAHCAVCVYSGGAGAPPPAFHVAPAVTAHAQSASIPTLPFASAPRRSPSLARAPPAGGRISR